MKYLVLFLLLGVLCANYLLSVAQPEIETTLALEQFENPSVVTDTFYRNVYQTVSHFLSVLSIVFFGWFLFLSYKGK